MKNLKLQKKHSLIISAHLFESVLGFYFSIFLKNSILDV